MSFLIVEQITYAIGTTGWWSGLSIGLGYAALVVLAARLLRGDDRVRFERIWGIAILALMFLKHGNLLYTGQAAGTEKFSSTISRNDRRRWVTATSILTLDEDLVIGTLTDVKANTFTLRPLICEPFDSSKR